MRGTVDHAAHTSVPAASVHRSISADHPRRGELAGTTAWQRFAPSACSGSAEARSTGSWRRDGGSVPGWGVVRDCARSEDVAAGSVGGRARRRGRWQSPATKSAAAIHGIGWLRRGTGRPLGAAGSPSGGGPAWWSTESAVSPGPTSWCSSGMPVTTASRTIIDLAAAGMPPGRLGDVIDDDRASACRRPADRRRDRCLGRGRARAAARSS